MNKRKELTPEQRGAILYGYKHGDSFREVASHVGCSKTAVGKTIKRYLETGSTEPQASRTGRPSIIQAPSRTTLKNLVLENRRLNLSQITNSLIARTKLNVSRSTVRRALHNENLQCRVARPKPLVSAANIAARLSWCKEREDWSAQQFRCVLWSDETSMSLFRQGTCCRVWQEPHEEWNLECVSSTVKRSPARMYWGSFTYYGIGPLVLLREAVTAVSYVETLQEHLLPALDLIPRGKNLGRPYFQHDNARPHAAKLTRNFLAEQDIRVLDWPA